MKFLGELPEGDEIEDVNSAPVYYDEETGVFKIGEIEEADEGWFTRAQIRALYSFMEAVDGQSR